jgi:hypothetical protein
VIDTLLGQDYVSGLFVDEALGHFAGTLPLNAIHLAGDARTPRPSIVVNFRSFDLGCAVPETCTAEIADTTLQQGQGMHGSFSRAETKNFMAAVGPGFKRRFSNPAPASNADIGRTVAALLGLDIAPKGRLLGRVLTEATPGGELPAFDSQVIAAPPAPNGLTTVLEYQRVGEVPYFDAAGFPGRTQGLKTAPGRAAVHADR